MREETKKLIQGKLHRWLEGEQTHALDENGCWVHVRDIKSIVKSETDLLQKTIDKLKGRQVKEEVSQEVLELATRYANAHHWDGPSWHAMYDAYLAGHLSSKPFEHNAKPEDNNGSGNN
jgi:hypothetical protein